jgi:hypothetical protein
LKQGIHCEKLVSYFSKYVFYEHLRQHICGAIPHDRHSPGVGIQATVRYIHVHGNPTIHYLVRLQQLLLRPPQHDKSYVLQGSESSWTVIHNQWSIICLVL